MLIKFLHGLNVTWCRLTIHTKSKFTTLTCNNHDLAVLLVIEKLQWLLSIPSQSEVSHSHTLFLLTFSIIALTFLSVSVQFK